MLKDLLYLSLLVGIFAFSVALSFGVSTTAEARNIPLVSVQPTPVPGSPDGLPSWNTYRGLKIGMTTSEARSKLGNPKEKSDDQDYFVFSDNETAQVVYESDHTVRLISINYLGKLQAAPPAKDVIGTDIEAKADGSLNKRVMFPKAGYWVSYLKTAGDDPMIVITMQKMAKEQ